MPPAIETDGLTKRFRSLRSWRDVFLAPWRPLGATAVDDVNLRVEPGEVFGLLGQNGAGKTTLIRMLTTLLLPTSGTARVGGDDVAADPRSVRRRIGLISGDERSFYWRLTGRQNLAFFAALQHLPEELAARRASDLADRLGIAAHLDRPFGQLSTGQRQKLAIARGLLSEPEVLFMDEPTRSLDPISAVAIREFVAEHIVRELGRTVVLATHSMPEAEALCTRLAFIQAGRIVAEGTVASLRRQIGYGLRIEVRLRGATDTTAERLRSLPGVLSAELALSADLAPGDGTGTVQAVLADEDRVGSVLRTLLDDGIEVLGCQTRELSLEEIYVRTLSDPPAAAPEPLAEPVPVR